MPYPTFFFLTSDRKENLNADLLIKVQWCRHYNFHTQAFHFLDKKTMWNEKSEWACEWVTEEDNEKKMFKKGNNENKQKCQLVTSFIRWHCHQNNTCY